MQLGTSDNLESKFRALEGGDVEDELAMMKKGMLTGSRTSSPQQLPEGRPIRCVCTSEQPPLTIAPDYRRKSLVPTERPSVRIKAHWHYSRPLCLTGVPAEMN